MVVGGNQRRRSTRGSSLSAAELDAVARPLIEAGRPDLLGLDPTAIDLTAFRGRPWARLAVAAALVATDPGGTDAAQAIRSARRSFRARGDAVGLGYAAYVDGTRLLGLGRHRDAAVRWREVRALLGDDSPVSCNALAHLSLVAYHAGDPNEAAVVADEAVGLARIRLDRRGEGRALLYRALADLVLGDFERSIAALDAADLAFAEMTDDDDRFEWPLAAMGRAVAHGFRGRCDEAWFEAAEALRRAEQLDIAWYRGMALATRAEFCAPADPARAVADGRAALEILRSIGDRWWENCALRALGIATSAAGHPQAARRLLVEALATSPSAFEQARCGLALGTVLVDLGDLAAARPVLEASVAVFRPAGARLLLCQALRLLANISPHLAGSLRDEACAATRDDLAFERVLAQGWPEASSRITVRCREPMAIAIDGREVTFMTEHAQRALVILALAGDAGLHQEELAEHLWPAAPAARVGQRLRTLLWQARKALGSEAWRLQRRPRMIVLDTTNVTVDLLGLLDEARSLAAPGHGPIDPARADEVLERLTAPTLTRYRYEPWAEAWLDRAQLAADLLRAVSSSNLRLA